MNGIMKKELLLSGKKHMLFAGMCLFILGYVCPVCGAPKIRESVITEEGDLRIYTSGISENIPLTILAGTGECTVEEIEPGGLRTWILVDDSESISALEREQICSFLLQLVDSHKDQEEIRFSCFGESIQTINDFSRDYEAVRTSVEQLTYHNQDTYVLQTLAEALEELGDMDRTHCASRILLVTDGGEFFGGDYRVEELREQLMKRGIPVYTLGCGNNRENLEGMSYLSRKSGGEFIEAESLRRDQAFMEEEGEQRAFFVRIPDELKDGAAHQIALYEENNLSDPLAVREIVFSQMAAVKVTVKVTETPIPTATPTPTAVPTENPEEIRLERDLLLSETRRKEHMRRLFWIGGGLLALLGLTIGAGIWVNSRKKVREKRFRGEIGEEVFRDSKVSGESMDERREELPQKTGASEREEMDILLKDTQNPARFFRKRVTGNVLFGKDRRVSDWIISGDASISRRHGRLSLKEGKLSIEDLHSRNGIWLNKVRLSAPEILQDGDLLRLGDSEFTVSLQRHC